MDPDFQEAALDGDAGMLRAMLEIGAPVDALDRYGQTALMLAARGGHVDAVRALVYAGAFLDHTAKHDLSALMLAAIGGHEEVVEVLLRAGADTGLRGTGAPGFAGKTALDIAEELGRDEVAAQLREVRG